MVKCILIIGLSLLYNIMALVADSNFTNNLVSVSAFSPFPTGGGNKVLQLNVTGGGVLLSNAGALSSASKVDCLIDAVVNSGGSGPEGSFGFILNRDGSGKFYYLSIKVGPSLDLTFKINRYSGGIGGSFTELATFGTAASFISTGTIFTIRATVRNEGNGPNMSLLVNDIGVLSYIDRDSINQINSGQPGVASNILSGDGNNFDRYIDNWFARSVD
jgi:hypothetical protein